jgi:hypothetical protein
MADRRSAADTEDFGICPRCGHCFDKDLYDVEQCMQCRTEFSTKCCLGSVEELGYGYRCIECEKTL